MLRLDPRNILTGYFILINVQGILKLPPDEIIEEEAVRKLHFPPTISRALIRLRYKGFGELNTNSVLFKRDNYPFVVTRYVTDHTHRKLPHLTQPFRRVGYRRVVLLQEVVNHLQEFQNRRINDHMSRWGEGEVNDLVLLEPVHTVFHLTSGVLRVEHRHDFDINPFVLKRRAQQDTQFLVVQYGSFYHLTTVRPSFTTVHLRNNKDLVPENSIRVPICMRTVTHIAPYGLRNLILTVVVNGGGGV
ncbi:hypothetical protein PAERUG_E6_London_17_VIM_2_12_12_03084 [Pseudomonas aeruginosa]|nr:hypothetical protein PAERUG_E6_London_17_VIM_2_12_12_03084 [Pseudomonas aeruginosa]